MTDAQMVTLAVAILAVFAGTIFNNSRITDLRNDMNSRFGDMSGRFADISRHIDDKFALLSQQMKAMEENIMRILADHETRDPETRAAG
jgi:hypothetical protein